ncbi:MAG: FtsX-like permease family protein [Anaerolineae bacterium]|nr:FtsX-like permease family protein [Anaerolineae bacterium]
MKRRKLRTVIVAMALIVGVALVGALLNIVDTQRQFSVQTIGAQTGGYDLSIKKSDLAATTMFEVAPVDQLARNTYSEIIAVHPRIQGSAEARKADSPNGSAVTVIALNTTQDDLVKLAGGGLFGGGPGGPPGPSGAFGFGLSQGIYPPGPGQVYLDAGSAGALGANVGDEVLLSYVKPVAREEGKEASSGHSSAREEATFIVSGIGVLSGLPNDASSPAVIRLDDAQRWLRAPNMADQLLIIWKNDTSSGNDARAQVTQARAIGEQLRDALQSKLGPEFKVSLPKYTTLEGAATGFIFLQTFITLYGFLSMSIVGLMVNALMNTTVQEQKHDLAVLRVLGAPRNRLFEAVVLEVILLGTVGIVFGLLLGRVINDQVITPILSLALDLPTGVSPQWTLQAALTPTLITAAVLALATISPARTAAATKVMVVLNPAAADQPTLEDISKLRERRTNYNLLIVGMVMLAFSSIILFVVPVVFSSGDSNGIAIVIFTTFILLVVGMALIFFFVTTPLERLLVALYNLVNKRAAFFAGRYALRGKGRNALISLMVVMSGVFPTLLATQIALQDANLETDTRFQTGAPLVAERNVFFGGNFRVFSRFVPEQDKLSDKDIDAVKGQPGIGQVVGLANDFRDVEISDRIQLRSAQVSVLGVQGDLTQVLYNDLFRWGQGDARSIQRLATDPTG